MLDAGHNVAKEAPTEFARAVNDLLNDLVGPRMSQVKDPQARRVRHDPRDHGEDRGDHDRGDGHPEVFAVALTTRRAATHSKVGAIALGTLSVCRFAVLTSSRSWY